MEAPFTDFLDDGDCEEPLMLFFEGEGWDGPLRAGFGSVATARTRLVRVRIETLLERGTEKRTGSIPQ